VSHSDVIQFPQGTDLVDRAGNEVLVKLQRAAGIAEQNTQHAVALAHQATMQLRVAEDRIARLEAEAWSYRERAERAEAWLQRISQEIEQSFPSRGQQQPQQSDDYAPKRQNVRR
jgi:hypothetical protein